MKISKFLFFVFVLLLFYRCSSEKLANNAFFISPIGNDNWSGKLAEPNKTKTDGPFATFKKARDAVRKDKQANNFPDAGITIYIREGNYSISETIKLSSMDSGEKNALIIWRSYPGEKVSLLGGRTINEYHKVTDQGVLNRINKSVRDKLVEVNLRDLGILDYGELKPKGFGFRPHKPLAMELFFKGKAMTLARYPNEGWLTIKDVPQFGAKVVHKGSQVHKRFGLPIGRHFGRFSYEGYRPKQWAKDNNIWMHGYWTWDWADSYNKVKKFDTESGEVFPASPYSNYGYTKGQRYYFLNILEELDTPGEYYIDRKRGKLYFLPASEITNNSMSVSILEEPMVTVENASFISFQGITFECSRTSAIIINGGSNNKIAGCVFRNLGNTAVYINGGEQNGITSCDIYDIAAGGIHFSGGDRQTLTPGNNYAKNNHIHDFGRIYRTYSPAIRMSGVGNRISHNYIHDSPHVGVLFYGNEHVLEYNEIHDIAQETGDVGAFYIGRDWTARGNIIRYNYFHHLHGPGLHGVRAVYLDDWASGTTVFGNVFFKAGRAAFIGGGRDNIIENNLFIECDPSVQVDARGLSWATYYFDKTDKNYVNTLFDRMDAVKFSQPPYSEKYPELLKYYEDDPAIPKHNKIIRNVSYGGRFIDLYDGLTFDIVTVKDNLIADPIILKGSLESDQSDKFQMYKYGHQATMEQMKDNMFQESDPGFVDVKNKKFQLKDDSPAYRLGFKKIPIEKIGLYEDEYRKAISK